MPFDMTLVQRGARLRRSPFFDATQRYGAKGFDAFLAKLDGYAEVHTRDAE